MAQLKLHAIFPEFPNDVCHLIWESSMKMAQKRARIILKGAPFRYGHEITKDANKVDEVLLKFPKGKSVDERLYKYGRQEFVDMVYESIDVPKFVPKKGGIKSVYQGPYGEALIYYNSRTGFWEATLVIDGATKSHFTVVLKAHNEELAGQEAVAVLRDEGQNKHMFTIRPTREQAMEAVKTMLAYAGDNPEREGLVGTPDRVVRAYDEFFAGYQQYSWDVLKTSFSESGSYNEMVVLTDIDFDSHCEHHMVPFTGVAHIAYFPDKTVVGISKLARLVEIYARRLQIQEKMTAQIADNLQINLQPKGVAVVIVGQHMCMTTRGVKKKRVKMITSTMTGVFQDDAKVRSEFMNLIGNPKSG